ncbi:hypothetical protein DPN68_06170 [Flavobacterium tibetense]|uniref:Uncharacterized protein n=1 Tax=Flavobacterium tibetense TaxID=2233533 RepID=A0A365P241_9FLAO|nr:hypothetical protein DPN68_06170 [Flavobacterium tibetense]
MTFLTSLIVFNIFYNIFEKIFIVETSYGFEYRFSELDWILNYFYEGYHYEATLLNIIMTLLLSIYISYLIVKNVWEFIFSNKS